MKPLVVILFLLAAVSSNAQTGTIRGTALDANTSDPLISAPVYNKSKSHYSRVDLKGAYTLKLPAGEHWIYCEYTGYQTDSLLVKIVEGQVITVDFRLLSIDQVIDINFIVTAERIRGSIGDADNTQKNDDNVSDVISREQIKNFSANSAVDVAVKTPGLSVEGGKYVYVRGLSDRYSKTTINGSEIPGLDPNRNSVQMDLFPSSLIQNLSVYKSFSPDLPASFTGGLVNIETVEFPSSFQINVSAKLTYNPQTSLNQDFLTQKTSGGLDFLGFDNGSRGIPTEALRYSTDDFNGLYLNDDATLNELGKKFSRDFSPITKRSFLNQQYSFTIGDQIDPSEENKTYPKIGYMLGVTYRKNYSYYDGGAQGRYSLVGDVETNDLLNPELELEDTKGDEDVMWASLGNFAVKFNEFNNIGLTAARFQNGISSTRYLEGNNFADAQDLYFQTRTLYYQERALSTVQLKGDHLLGRKDTGENAKNNLDNLKINWVGSYTLSEQETPELKFFTNDYTLNNGDTLFDIKPQLYSDPSQFYRYMSETNVDLKLHFVKPITTLKEESGAIKWGLSYVGKDRAFSEKRYDFNIQDGPATAYNGNVEDFFADENFDSPNFSDGFLYVQDASEKRNNYSGFERTYAAYAMADAYVAPKLKLVAGARAELDTISSSTYTLSGNNNQGGFRKLDILPSAVASYDIKRDTMKIRAAYTRTLARPTFRELAPFSSFDFVGGNVFIGNEDLQRTLVDNLDLRWENYMKFSQKLTIGVFAKKFYDPIERAFNPETANAELTWRNVDEATVYGAEIDFRKRLSNNHKTGWVYRTFIGGNLTYVYSEVSIPEKEYVAILSQDPNASPKRVMFGQAPYIVNANLSYSDSLNRFKANVNFGVSGPKLSVVTVGGTPNVFENARPNLNANVSYKLGKYQQYSLKLSAGNLLNPEINQVYTFKGEEYLFSSYKTGRTFSLSISYTFDKIKKNEIDLIQPEGE